MIIRLLVTAVISLAGLGNGLPQNSDFDSNTVGTNPSIERVYFSESGQYLSGAFFSFWMENGAEQVFGLPVTGSLSQDGILVQYFEYAVLERHFSDAAGTRIFLRRLGSDAVKPVSKQNSSFSRTGDTGNGTYFPESGHNIDPQFTEFWKSIGGLQVFGFPISEAFVSNGSTIQYFERAVLELDSASGEITRRPLGQLAAETDGLDTSPKLYDGQATQYSPEVVGRGGSGEQDKVVYLTFDDGPHPVWTPQILGILREYDAAATFFVLGQYAQFYPDIIANISMEGHSLANHTYNHPSLAGMSFEQVAWQLRETERALKPYMVPCMRPPYGAMDGNTKRFANDLGYDVILWDVDPRDWQRPGAGVIADRILQSVGPGDVVLLHDGGDDRSQSVAALRIVMEELDARGYRFEAMCA